MNPSVPHFDTSLTWSWTLAAPGGRTLKSKMKAIPLKLTTALDSTLKGISWMGSRIPEV